MARVTRRSFFRAAFAVAVGGLAMPKAWTADADSPDWIRVPAGQPLATRPDGRPYAPFAENSNDTWNELFIAAPTA